jgi:hypothetical protein
LSSERRDRFLKLERARPGRDDAPDPVPSSSTDRFRPPPERPLETAEERTGSQPFVRCLSCQMDNTIYAATCQNCAAELDTPAQRAFNQKLWADRQAQAESERRALAEREQARQRDAAEQARNRREVAEELARREKDRIDEELPDGPFGRGPGAGPRADTAGMRLLRLLPGLGWRIAAACVAIGIPLLLLLFGRGQIQMVGMMLLGLVIALFSPGRRRFRRW